MSSLDIFTDCSIRVLDKVNVRKYIDYDLGMREICPNNFGNNDRAKELRIIPEF